MTPDCRAWTERMVVAWGARAADLRGQEGRSAAVRAAALQCVVDKLRGRLETRSPANPHDADIVRLEQLLTGAAPRPGPHGIMFNVGPIMDGVRHRLASQLAVLRGEGPPAGAGPAPSLFPQPNPPPEARPFRSGPQLDMFSSIESAA